MELTHFNRSGKAHMVDVTAKADTKRVAAAEGRIVMNQSTLELVKKGQMGKGDVLGVSQVAGIMGAKRTSELIPMCHVLLLTGVDIEFAIHDQIDELHGSIDIKAIVKTTGKTGVEMEALTAVSVAALTIYDMCKAVDKAMVIEFVRLTAKSGGKSGDYVRDEI
ncbi:MAG: cyclic pyranopterin monophosphate synthase MoaC [Pelosinus sp.]|nr:cyclic pyranopterin monophosphate synthase MoaC [Pelosinus sp.]